MHDGQESVVGRVRSDATVAMYRYDAWGAFRGTATPAGMDASLAYAGQHWDEDLGLSYAQQRWYEPGTGRFWSEDPVFGDLQNPSSLQVFGYGNGNPLLFTDPRGTTVCMPGDPGSCFQEAEETAALCKGEKDELACRRRIAKNEIIGVAGGVAVAAAVVAAPEVIAAAAGAGAKGSVLLAAAGAVVTRYGNQAVNAVRALPAWGSQNPQKVVDTASVATSCIDSGTPEGCTLALVTHGMVPGGRPAPKALPAGPPPGKALPPGPPPPKALPPPATPLQAAKAAADQAQSRSPRPAAAGALQVRGRTFTGESQRGPLGKPVRPEVKDRLDSIPLEERSDFHGSCAEPQCISAALDAGVDPSGGRISTVNVRAPGNPKHGVEKPPCASCEALLKQYDIKARGDGE